MMRSDLKSRSERASAWRPMSISHLSFGPACRAICGSMFEILWTPLWLIKILVLVVLMLYLSIQYRPYRSRCAHSRVNVFQEMYDSTILSKIHITCIANPNSTCLFAMHLHCITVRRGGACAKTVPVPGDSRNRRPGLHAELLVPNMRKIHYVHDIQRCR